jgi:ABC-type multidrug transport system ATPase subunit
MYPSAGRVEVSGRVGALIEVRAGIHPDLTGRENTFLYGSLLGLKRREVARRFDDIVAFAELKDAIDRQTKFYSTGMQMRLGFAVAAFLEPHALLVDEVLAVGDATFQQRCLDRMRQVISQGATLVFVSHDLAAVEATCRRGIWLHHGLVQQDGAINDVLRSYRRSIEEAAEATPRLAGIVELMKAEVGGMSGSPAKSHEALEIMLRIASEEPRESRVYLGVSEGPAATIFSLRRDIHLSKGETVIKCTVRSLPLPRGRYYLWVGVYEGEGELDLLAWHPASHFDVIGPDLDRTPTAVVRVAPIHVDARWEVA